MDELVRNLKRAGVLSSPYVTAAFRAIDRKDFVPDEYRDEAYGDYPLPIGHGQTISQPYTVAFMLDLLDPKPGERILDVGAGSGWQTALLAHVVGGEAEGRKTKDEGRVYAVERIPKLCAYARTNISKYNFLKRGIVEFRCGDASGGLADGAPFDKIIAAAAGAELPAAWQGEVRIGGVIVAPIGSSLWRYTKLEPEKWKTEEFPGFAFVPLVSGGSGRQGKGDEGEGAGNNATPRRRFPRRSWMIALLLAIAGYALAAPVSLSAPVRLEVAPGSGSRAIARQLKSSGLIRSAWTFVAYVTLTGRASALKPGTYEFQGRVAIPRLAAALVRGDPNERFITIPEGWDLRDIGTYLEENGIVSRHDLYAVTGAPAAVNQKGRFPPAGAGVELPPALAGKPPHAILEGYLYPDTYRIFRGATAADIVSRMLDNFGRKLDPDILREVLRQGKSVAEITTVASLVEKEVADPGDRRMVAGIIWQRLAEGMPLQVDATVNYATAKRATPSGEDLAVDSPYNTYRYPGLPPTPISNPGLDAIRAAVFPSASEYRYYLSAPDGRTIFSKTLQEHVRAKARYLR